MVPSKQKLKKDCPPPPHTPEENAETGDPEPIVGRESGIDVLLKGQGVPVEIPYALLSRMEQAKVGVADVIFLIEMLLDGRLRRVMS
jgi:hypothetical protein